MILGIEYLLKMGCSTHRLIAPASANNAFGTAMMV